MQQIINYIQKPNLFLLALLKKFWFLFSDKTYLKLRYYLEMHEKLNLNDPKKFTEKIQWLKLYDRKDEYTRLVDKITVKQYVESVISKDIIVPTLGVWNNFDERPIIAVAVQGS